MTMQQQAGYWDRIAQRYAAQPVADEASYQKKLQVTRGYLRRHMQVLEFGCGTGSTAVVHAPHVRHLHAIDISQNMLVIARARAEAANVRNIAFEQAAIETFAAPDGSFDVVLGLNVLHLVASPEAVIAKVQRLLKPGGIFVSSTDVLGEKSPLHQLMAPVGAALGLTPPSRAFTAATLEQAMAGAGLAIDYRWQPAPGKPVFVVARKGA